MLSKHPERCRFPHGHTRTIEVVASSQTLNASDMVLDFKALKLAMEAYIERLDHSMAINSDDPMIETLQTAYPEGLVIFEGVDPTTEVLAKDLFDSVSQVLSEGFSCQSDSGATYTICAGTVRLERVRVWETPSSWAEYCV